MNFVKKLSCKIGDDLVRSNVVNEEDEEIYIYGLNQILVSIISVLSAMIIGVIGGMLFEISVFMISYIPLRSFAGGYHAKTPTRCYLVSVIMLIAVLLSMKYLILPDWLYYTILLMAILVIFVFSPVEAMNKPLNKAEHKVYKRITICIASAEVTVSLLLKLIMMNGLFIAIIYSFVMMSVMLVLGQVKNSF